MTTGAYEALLESTVAANVANFPGGVYVDLHGVYEPRIGSVGRWRSLALVPWGVHFRAVPAADVATDVVKWVDASLAEVDRLRATWAPLGGPPDPAVFREGTWERAARATYNDAHYQCGLFLLTLAQELRKDLKADAFPFYLRLLRSAFALTSGAAGAERDASGLTSRVDRTSRSRVHERGRQRQLRQRGLQKDTGSGAICMR